MLPNMPVVGRKVGKGDRFPIFLGASEAGDLKISVKNIGRRPSVLKTPVGPKSRQNVMLRAITRRQDGLAPWALVTENKTSYIPTQAVRLRVG